MDLLRLNSPISAKTPPFLTPKRYDKHPSFFFFYAIPLPRGDMYMTIDAYVKKSMKL